MSDYSMTPYMRDLLSDLENGVKMPDTVTVRTEDIKILLDRVLVAEAILRDLQGVDKPEPEPEPTPFFAMDHITLTRLKNVTFGIRILEEGRRYRLSPYDLGSNALQLFYNGEIVSIDKHPYQVTLVDELTVDVERLDFPD